MPTLTEIKDKLVRVFDDKQAIVLADVIFDSYNELVKTSDFNELKDIVKDIGVKVGELGTKVGQLTEAQKMTDVKMGQLAEAQKMTDVKMGEMAEAQKMTDVKMGQLAEAQKMTDVKMGEMVEAQKMTDVKMGQLAEAQKATEKEILKLTKGLGETRSEVGGLSKSMSYAFENEAYRILPGLLKKEYGIEIKKRIVRAEIGGKEVNIFGIAEKDGKEIIVVGEAKLRLDERRTKKGEKDVFAELDEKVDIVRSEYKKEEIAKILITHYATIGFLKNAEQKGIIVIQSFEW